MKKKNEIDESVATGRRKTSVASVRIRPGSGKIDINGKELADYLTSSVQHKTVFSPFEKFGGNSGHDMIIRVKGGGIEGQVIAIRLGIARALVKRDENLHADFKEKGFLTRDPRKKERKKYGMAKARKKFQFSKR